MQEADHLRSRGADTGRKRKRSRRSGSPPLARSRPRPGRRPPQGRRIISARAEPTEHLPGPVPAGPDHLRSRGADPRKARTARATCGSPPLARSRLRRPGRAGRHRRITSARAEPTTNDKLFTSWYGGSPPLARSRHLDRRQEPVRRRITSARAEPTPAPAAGLRVVPDHLRSRRADIHEGIIRAGVIGSPPLTRSRRSRRRPGRRCGRITSARAEPTEAERDMEGRQPDHLRSRGADALPGHLLSSPRGSPPLARSRQLPDTRAAPHSRITSARAEPTTGCSSCTGWTTDHLRSRGADPTVRG